MNRTCGGVGFAGSVLEPEWVGPLSLDGEGDGRSGITGGGVVFFLFDGGTRPTGKVMGTDSDSRALYTKYMA